MTETTDTVARKPREYETIYILDPKVDPDEADRIAARMTDVVARMGGKLTKLDNWGKRKLAYPIRRNTRGVFVHMKYIGFGDIVAEVERNLRMLDAVMRHQSVLLRSHGVTLDVAVDPEEVKFRRLETTEDEPEPNLEERLGMIEREQSRPRSDGDLDDYGDDGMGDDDVGDDKE
jgi:small subunit ribosomal protein S6